MNFNARDYIACKMSESHLGSENYARMELTKKLSKVWDFLPDIPKPYMVMQSLGQDPWLVYPYDKNLITSITKIFDSEGGWSPDWRVREDEVETGNSRKSNVRVCFSHTSGLNVICEFSDTAPGATCIRKVIGKKTKEVDIVEFVCGEGEND